MKEKITKRQIQARDTRDRICRTAVELMEKKGLNNITVEEICRTARVSIGSFYNCFKSKHEILNEIFKVADDYFYEIVSKDLKDGSTRDKIIKFFHYYAAYNVDRGVDFVKQFYNVHNTTFIARGRHMQNVLHDIVEDGLRVGHIKSEKTSDEIVRYLFIAARGIVYDWCLHDGVYDLIEFTDDYMTSLVKVLE